MSIACFVKQFISLITCLFVMFCGSIIFRVSVSDDIICLNRFSGIMYNVASITLFKGKRIELSIFTSQYGEVVNLPMPEITNLNVFTGLVHVTVVDSNCVQNIQELVLSSLCQI